MDGGFRELSSVPDLDAEDIAAVLAVLVGGSQRVQRLPLSKRIVWIKRYGTEEPSRWQQSQTALSRLMPFDFLRPCPALPPSEMAEREIRRIGLFKKSGFATPSVLYSAKGALVLADVGLTVQQRPEALRDTQPAAHDDLLVACADELGRVHAAGLCHSRPYPRDMFLVDSRPGFMDFEEDPQSVMSLAAAQARDIWLLFLQLAPAARLGTGTLNMAHHAWSGRAPPAARTELRRMMGILGRFLLPARLIGRVHMGSDLRRFLVATGYLASATARNGAD